MNLNRELIQFANWYRHCADTKKSDHQIVDDYFKDIQNTVEAQANGASNGEAKVSGVNY